MRRNKVVDRLKTTESTLRALGIAALYLFGSYARDEAKAGSDIDVFVDPKDNGAFGFISFMDAYETIQQAVGNKVDYGTRSGLHPGLRAQIEQDAIRIF